MDESDNTFHVQLFSACFYKMFTSIENVITITLNGFLKSNCKIPFYNTLVPKRVVRSIFLYNIGTCGIVEEMKSTFGFVILNNLESFDELI